MHASMYAKYAICAKAQKKKYTKKKHNFFSFVPFPSQKNAVKVSKTVLVNAVM